MTESYKIPRYQLKAGDKANRVVSRKMWAAIKLYAFNRALTMVKTTYRLLYIGLACEMRKKKKSPLEQKLQEAIENQQTDDNLSSPSHRHSDIIRYHY